MGIPFLEARLSNIHALEALRRHADFSGQAVETICGLGSRGCDLALEYALGNKSETDAAGIDFPDIGEHEGRRGAAFSPRVVATQARNLEIGPGGPPPGTGEDPRWICANLRS